MEQTEILWQQKKRKTDTLNTLNDKFEYLRKKLKEQIKKMSQ